MLWDDTHTHTHTRHHVSAGRQARGGCKPPVAGPAVKLRVELALAGGPVRVPAFKCTSCSDAKCTKGCQHAYYKFYAYVRPENLKPDWSRDRIVEEISGLGVPCFQGSCSEVYLERAFDGTGWRPEPRLPIAKELGETSLMFLVHPTLTNGELEKTAAVLGEVLSQAQRG